MNNVLLFSVTVGLLLAVIYGFMDIAMSKAAKHLTEIELVFRIQVVALCMLIVAAIVMRQNVGVSFVAIMLAIALGFIYAFSLLSYSKALKTGPVGVVTPISNAYPIIAVPLSIILFKESVSPLGIVAIMLIIAGVFIVDVRLSHKRVVARKQKYLLFAFATLLLWGAYMPVDALLVGRAGWFAALFWEVVFTTLILYIMRIRYTHTHPYASKRSLLLPGVVIISVCEVTAGLLLNYGLEKGNVSVITPLLTTSIVLTVVFAALFLRQPLKRYQVAGVSVAIIGILLMSIS